MTDLVERLRSKSPYLHGSSAERVMAEAADEIERLTEEVDALRLVGTAHDAEMLRLETEIERLRATLQKIADDGKNCANHCRRQARTALEPQQQRERRRLRKATGSIADDPRTWEDDRPALEPEAMSREPEIFELLRADNVRLRAEIERLRANETAQRDGALALIVAGENQRAEIERLTYAQIEQLKDYGAGLEDILRRSALEPKP